MQNNLRKLDAAITVAKQVEIMFASHEVDIYLGGSLALWLQLSEFKDRQVGDVDIIFACESTKVQEKVKKKLEAFLAITGKANVGPEDECHHGFYFEIEDCYYLPFKFMGADINFLFADKRSMKLNPFNGDAHRDNLVKWQDVKLVHPLNIAYAKLGYVKDSPNREKHLADIKHIFECYPKSDIHMLLENYSSLSKPMIFHKYDLCIVGCTWLPNDQL